MRAVVRAPRAREAVALLAAAGLSIGIAALRLVFEPRFYFADDTVLGTVGIWRQMRRMVETGEVSFLDPHSWQAGNYLAEGQWGLLNPVSWAIALGNGAVDDLVVYVTLIKLLFIGVFGAGVYVLSRSFGAGTWWALAAAVIAPTAGFTAYMDAPSWISGLIDSAYFAVAWWGLRRVVQGRNPVAYLVAAYLLVTYGYVFGVIMLALVLGFELVRALVQRRRARILRVLAAAAFAGLLTVVVYLPGVLTASVTERGGGGIAQAFFLSADLSDLAGAVSPTAPTSIGSWTGPVTQAPLLAVSWALLLVILVWPALRASVTSLAVPLLFAAVVLLLVVGPSHIGPLRWPVRFMPFVVTALCVVLAVVLSRGFPRLVTWRRFALAAAVAVLLLWVAWSQTPGERHIVILGAVVVGLVALATWIASARWAQRARTPIAAGLVILSTAAFIVPQMLVFPRTPLPTLPVPASASELEGVLADGIDDGISVGDVYSVFQDPEVYDEILPANLWYFSSTRVSSTYTVLPVTAYVADLCTEFRGATCPEALGVLLSEDATTGLTVSELLGVNTIAVIRASFPDGVPDLGPDWRTLSTGDSTEIFVRRDPVGVAGGVAWSGAGTEVSVVDESSTGITLRVDAVGSDARAVLKRLAWPGYIAEGAALADPLRGYLLTVDLSKAVPGDLVTVAFRPPGFAVEAVAWVLALAIIPTWLILRGHRRKVSRR